MPCEPASWFYVKKGAVGGFGTTSASFQAQLNDKCLKLNRILVLGMHICQASRFSPTEKVCISLYIEHVVFWKHDKFCGILSKAATTPSLHLALTILLKFLPVFCVDAQTQGMFPKKY